LDFIWNTMKFHNHLHPIQEVVLNNWTDIADPHLPQNSSSAASTMLELQNHIPINLGTLSHLGDGPLDQWISNCLRYTTPIAEKNVTYLCCACQISTTHPKISPDQDPFSSSNNMVKDLPKNRVLKSFVVNVVFFST